MEQIHLIRNGYLVNPGNGEEGYADIHIRDGLIEKIVFKSEEKAQLDANLEEEGVINAACGTVTMGLKGELLTDMQALKDAGAVGFTDDGIPLMDEEVLTRAMEECARLDRPISLHEENKDLIENNGINRGKASEYYRVGGSPKEAEISLIERDLKIAIKTGAALDVQHVSARESVDLIREAVKKQGENRRIHAEATPQHFTLTEDALIEKGADAKLNPPLRTEEDRLGIIEGLRDNVIDHERREGCSAHYICAQRHDRTGNGTVLKLRETGSGGGDPSAGGDRQAYL